MLYNNINYSTDISYLTNVFVREYDISKANISVLFSKGVISEKIYNDLYKASRMERQVYVGNLQKNKEISDTLKAGIIEAKKMLFEANNIRDYEVLSIKNDAVFIIGRPLEYTDFGLVKFANKNSYTSYFKFARLEMFYYYNSISKEEHIDVKGIDDDILVYHNEFLLQLFKDIFFAIQVYGISAALQMLKGFYMQYISYSLPVGFYRNFDIKSLYTLKQKGFLGSIYQSIAVDEKNKFDIDILYNAKLLMELNKLLCSMIKK